MARRGLLVVLGCLGALVPAASSADKDAFTMLHAQCMRHVWQLALSPDGQSVAYALDGGETWVSSTGGEPDDRLVLDRGWVGQLTWSPDGRELRFLAVDERGITQVWRLPLGPGGRAETVTAQRSDVVEYAFSRDGRRLALLTEEPSPVPASALSSSRAAGKPVDLLFDGADLRGVLLLFSDLSGVSVVVDSDVKGTVHARFRQKPLEEAFEVLLASHGLGSTRRGGVVRVSRQSTLGEEGSPARPRAEPIVIEDAYFKREGDGYLPPDRERQLVVLDLVRGVQVAVPGVPWGAKGLAWSPGGRLLAFAGVQLSDDREPSWDVFVVAPSERKAPRCLTPTPIDEDSPSFTPDGAEVVYRVQASPTDSPSDTQRLAVVDVATGKGRVLLWSFDGEIEEPRVAPDSRHAWFLLPDNGTVRLARVPIDGGRLEIVVGDEREVTAFDVGAGGRAAFVSSTMSRPPSVYTVTPARVVRLVADLTSGWADRVRLASGRRISARAAGGPTVEAFFLPARGQGAGGAPPPAIVWLHGGPHAQQTASFDPFFQLLSEAGFAVLLPNPRGSSGRGWAFSASTDRGWGTCDYDDVMALVDAAVRQGLVDGERLGVGGWSYGGYFTKQILTRTNRFKAAVSGASLSNMLGDYGVSDTPYWTEMRLGLPWAAPARYIDASPLCRVDRVRTPTLVLCGQDDMRTPLGHSEQWYHALKRVGVEAQLVIYPGEGHSPSSAAWEDVMVRSIGWYSRLLRPGPQQPRPRPAKAAAVSAGGGR